MVCASTVGAETEDAGESAEARATPVLVSTSACVAVVSVLCCWARTSSFSSQGSCCCCCCLLFVVDGEDGSGGVSGEGEVEASAAVCASAMLLAFIFFVVVWIGMYAMTSDIFVCALH